MASSLPSTVSDRITDATGQRTTRRPGTGMMRRVRRRLRNATLEVLLVALAFVVGVSVLAPGMLYGRWFAAGPTSSLDRPCAGISSGTVAALVTSARRTVETEPDGWSWTCRWRSSDDSALRTTNPTLEATATRWGKWGSASPSETAAKEYAYAATRQLLEVQSEGDSAKARAAGFGVFVQPRVGDRAQLYVGYGQDRTGHEVRVVALRGNVVVSVRLVAYRVSVARMRDVAARTARDAVSAL